MTDNEIIKALECCTSGTTSECCNKCPFSPEDICDKDGNALEKYALALINRQKAEIVKLEAEIDRLNYILQCYALEHGTAVDKERFLKPARAEAVKEFAEMLKEIVDGNSSGYLFIPEKRFDNLVKEFTEGEKT